MKNLRQLISDVMRNPPALYYSDGAECLNIAQKYQNIKQLIEKDADSDSVVGIQLPKEPEYFLCILACMEIGIPYVPLKEGFPRSRMQEIQEDSGLSFVINKEKLAGAADLGGEGGTASEELVDGVQPLYIIFTSGSTGRPKGVVISRQAFWAYAVWLSDYLTDVNSQDRVLQVTEFTFDISLIDIVLYLTKQTPLYFTGFGGAIFKMAQEISDKKISVMSTVPNNVNMLLSDFIASKSDFSSLKNVMIGGARFSYGLYQKVCQYYRNKNVSNFYGPTEFTIYSHAKKLTFDESVDCRDANVTIGTANVGTEAEVYANGVFCGEYESGELLLAGPQIMNEYINNPGKTNEAILALGGKFYYKTGDLSYKNESGEFFITGRLDDTIKYRGYRINLLDIDSYIAKLPYIDDVTTIAVPDEIKENITVCFVVLKADMEDISPSKMKEDLKEYLVDYQIPEKIRFVSSYPTNVSGKVCKKQLLELYRAN